MSDKTGGPAFPSTIADDTLHVPGMTLRDFFAAAALQGLLANPKLAAVIQQNGGARGGWIENSAWAWGSSMVEHRDDSE